MSKIIALFLISILASGCATYEFKKGKKPYDTGYVVSRDGYVILEYTLGRDGAAASDMGLAKGRFKERRRIVEHYYKKIGLIDNHFKMVAWNPVIYTFKTFKGFFRLPFVAISDYRYEHDLRYRERLKALEAKADQREEARIRRLIKELWGRIGIDTATHGAIDDKSTGGKSIERQEAIEQDMSVALEEKPALPVEKIPQDKQARVKKPVSQLTQDSLVIAKPQKGFSPLTVRFSFRRPKELTGKIVSYSWDFSDGDTSSGPKPTNTFYSGTYQPQYFNVTLTVKDNLGNTATGATTIEVLNR